MQVTVDGFLTNSDTPVVTQKKSGWLSGWLSLRTTLRTSVWNMLNQTPVIEFYKVLFILLTVAIESRKTELE